MWKWLHASLVLALSSPVLAGPKLVIPGGTERELGDVAWGDTAWQELRLRNVGDELLDVRVVVPG